MGLESCAFATLGHYKPSVQRRKPFHETRSAPLSKVRHDRPRVDPPQFKNFRITRHWRRGRIRPGHDSEALDRFDRKGIGERHFLEPLPPRPLCPIILLQDHRPPPWARRRATHLAGSQ